MLDCNWSSHTLRISCERVLTRKDFSGVVKRRLSPSVHTHRVVKGYEYSELPLTWQRKSEKRMKLLLDLLIPEVTSFNGTKADVKITLL